MDKRKYIIKMLEDKTCHREVAYKAQVSQRTLLNACNPDHSLSTSTTTRLYECLKEIERTTVYGLIEKFRTKRKAK